MPDAPGPPGGCPLPPEVGAKEEKELTFEGSDSMDAKGEGGGGSTAGCAMYKGIKRCLGIKERAQDRNHK